MTIWRPALHPDAMPMIQSGMRERKG